ncbi:MAG: hypothetical protein ACLSG8_05125 [Barnesiella sp.]
MQILKNGSGCKFGPVFSLFLKMERRLSTSAGYFMSDPILLGIKLIAFAE